MSHVTQQESLILQAARVHQAPDWERLMEASVTPALVIGGERRLHRTTFLATRSGEKTAKPAKANP